ncbi:MAG: hypothetical protein JO133_07700 [Burkholderiaceae bacterium]|nr:hypothetical protein [Burkholderiaceae bacterium]
MEATRKAPAVGDVQDFPPARNRGSFTLRELADACMASYEGRDGSRVQRLQAWCALLGDRVAADWDGDDVADALDAIARSPQSDDQAKGARGAPS